MMRVVLKALANAPLLLSSVSRMLAEDPVNFALQVVRRMPASVRDRLSKLPEPRSTSLRHALWSVMLDRPDSADSPLLETTTPGVSFRLRQRIRLQQGHPPLPPASDSDRARFAWNRGRISEALSLASGRLRERYGAQRRTLDPSFLPSLTQQTGVLRGGRLPSATLLRESTQGSVRVLHVLTNSLPWTQSGYALRSHSVLMAQRQAGVGAAAVTRLAYPVTIGRVSAGVADVCEGVTYGRLLPWVLPRLEDERLASYAQQVRRVAQRCQAQVLHTTTPFTNAVAVCAAARSLGVPWVYEMRGELEKTWLARNSVEIQPELERSERFHLMRDRETQMAHLADAVVVLSQVQRASLIERGIPAHKIHVVPNAVDEALLDVARDTAGARARLGLESAFWVGCVSSLVDYEGIDTLIRAVALMRESGCPVRCAVVGDGVSRTSLRALTETLGLSDVIVFPGRVAPDVAHDWYGALDVMVIPRKDTEVTRSVTPMKGLQAMVLGVPQVVSDLPALVEVGSADGQGLSVPAEDPHALADALALLEQDAGLRNSLGKRGRELARQRTWQAHGRYYADLYQQLKRRADE